MPEGIGDGLRPVPSVDLGAFPLWLRIEQAVGGVIMLSVVVRTNLRVVRSAMLGGSEQPATTPVARP